MFDEDKITDYGDSDKQKGVKYGFDFDFTTTPSGRKDDEKRGGKNDGEGAELEWREGLAEKEPAKNEIKNGGKLHKNTKVGGIIKFESAIVGDASETGHNTRSCE